MQLKKNQKINDEDLTIEKVKQFKGFENISDEQAQHIADTLKKFSIIVYNYFQRTNKQARDNF
jgi:hypothetical protein